MFNNTTPNEENQIKGVEKAIGTTNNGSKDTVEPSADISSLPITPKPPKYRIIPGKIPVLDRPLMLIGNQAYAATWQSMVVTIEEEKNKDGTITKFEPPKEIVEWRWVVLCTDGSVYGMEQSLEEFGLIIHLPEKLKPENNWAGEGILRYLDKEYPDPRVLFGKLVSVLDYFIDFHKSLSDQKTMCEFVACYILSTWFLDAFNVAGYLWITGERGSGKTNLLMLISRLAYLGEFITASGSFASLRDMADYGATLCCDDAENITDPKKTDPDKMSLLLAGNRKGLTVPLKEQGPDKKWHTRHVNAYCPKAFSAIRVPDSTLASRTIIVPMLRTPNASKGNIDPMDDEIWPSNRSSIQDDLWAVALRNLPKLPGIDKWVGKNAKLVGRNLQPWRGILAVAKWLDNSGVAGLYNRMEELALSYQQERSELELADFNRVIILALCKCAISAIRAKSAKFIQKKVPLSVVDVVAAIKVVVEEEELELELDWISEKKIGKRLTKLRFPKAPRSGGKGSRLRLVNIKDLTDLAKSYNIDFNSQLDALQLSLASIPHSENGTHGTDGTNGSGQSVSLEDEVPGKPSQPCYSCYGESYWQRPDGGWVCATCHPKPDVG